MSLMPWQSGWAALACIHGGLRGLKRLSAYGGTATNSGSSNSDWWFEQQQRLVPRTAAMSDQRLGMPVGGSPVTVLWLANVLWLVMCFMMCSMMWLWDVFRDVVCDVIQDVVCDVFMCCVLWCVLWCELGCGVWCDYGMWFGMWIGMCFGMWFGMWLFGMCFGMWFWKYDVIHDVIHDVVHDVVLPCAKSWALSENSKSGRILDNSENSPRYFDLPEISQGGSPPLTTFYTAWTFPFKEALNQCTSTRAAPLAGCSWPSKNTTTRWILDFSTANEAHGCVRYE